jgi:hypothetical protein
MDGSKSTAIGNKVEADIIQILEAIPVVVKVWKDSANSKFDIYYTLKDEAIPRGLQVKAISIKTETESGRKDYQIASLKSYPNGMLIVACNKEEGVGLAYLNEDQYHGSSATMTKGAKQGGRFSKLLLEWDLFKDRLAQLIPLGTIVTEEVFKSSITPNMQASVESLKRFFIFCKKYSFTCNEVQDTSSKTDIIFEGARAQLKYTANTVDARNHC